MLRLALIFLLIAIVSGLLFGANIVTGIALDAARIFFVLFIVLAILSFLGGTFHRSRIEEL